MFRRCSPLSEVNSEAPDARKVATRINGVGRCNSRSGPVPEDNQPGHHLATEQDQPPAEDFVARASGADTDATRPGAEPA